VSLYNRSRYLFATLYRHRFLCPLSVLSEIADCEAFLRELRGLGSASAEVEAIVRAQMGRMSREVQRIDAPPRR
jgi:hypothetical protein